jgi:hypothetical protein
MDRRTLLKASAALPIAMASLERPLRRPPAGGRRAGARRLWDPRRNPVVDAVRDGLFGSWEGNWMAFNTAHDVALPNATDRAPLGFFMYPEAETGGTPRDCLDPDNFKYTITARAV